MAVLLAAIDLEDEAMVEALAQPTKRHFFTRRNKMHDERQWEVVHDIDPDGPVSDDSIRVIARFETDAQAQAFSDHQQRRFVARAAISALRAMVLPNENGGDCE